VSVTGAQGFVQLTAWAPASETVLGLKASWLGRASLAGERVPPGFCIDAQASADIAAGDDRALARLRASLDVLEASAPGEPLRVAVRASPTLSLPGALLTLLDVSADLETVRAALQKVLASCQLPAVNEQLAAQGLSAPAQPWLAVLVQRYLPVVTSSDFGAVVFTRDPATGERRLRGEYSLTGVSAVVSGRVRPKPLESNHAGHAGEAESLAVRDPDALAQIKALAQRLSTLFDQPLELELAYLNGEPWLLQARALVLSPRALVKVALDAIDEDSPSYATHLLQLARRGLASFSEYHFSETPADALVARGVAASMGAAVGVVVTDVQRAIERAQHEPVVLLRPDAIPEDIAAFRAAKAVVTTSGGLTCHAAVIARGLGVPAVVGCGGVRIDLAGRQLWGGRDTAQVVLREGDWVSVDARRGTMYFGQLPVEVRIHDAELRRLFVEIRKLRPTPLWVEGDARLALQLKEDACLDGALASWPSDGALPPGRGRECWIQIDVNQLEARVGSLPPGWGIVVCGELSFVQLARLRRLAPLRAFGLRLEHPQQLTGRSFDERLDLLVLGPGFDTSAQPAVTCDTSAPPHVSPGLSQINAARVLRVVTFPERAPVPRGDSVGWVCAASHVALAALRYATVRAGSTLDADAVRGLFRGEEGRSSP